MNTAESISLEEQIGRWRSFLRRREALYATDVAELEDHLREQIAALSDAGLSHDEAFLISVKRIGDLDALSREFAREHSERLWKQLVLTSSEDEPEPWRTEVTAAFGFAALAALAIKAPALLGILPETHQGFYVRNLSLFVLPFLAGYFAWKRRLGPEILRWLAGIFAAAALVANIYPVAPGSSTETLIALHLPLALFLVTGVAYARGRWQDVTARMDFIRFSGELFIYYVLIALGGGVLVAFMATIFQSIGLDVEPFFESWLLPCGAAGGVVVAAWLVEAKQSVIENMAPVLTRLFAPFFAAVLIGFLGTLIWTGRAIDIEREVLIAFDMLLVLVLGLLLYSISARDPLDPPNLSDVVQLVLVGSALLADSVALWAIATRIAEFGFSPNRVAALGLNLILLINLAQSASLYLRFIQNRGSFGSIERWQTDYLAVYALWAAVVAVLFPPLFGYV